MNFSNVEDINASGLNWQEFFETKSNNKKDENESTQPTALRYIIYNTVQKDNTVIYKLSQFIKGMRITASINQGTRFYFSFAEYFQEHDDLKKFEEFLNAYGVKCKLVLLEQPDGKKELYFDYTKPLNFSNNLSSGTYALTKFYLQ